MRRFVPFLMAGAGLLFMTQAAAAGPNCHCRTSTGDKVQVGNFTCLKTNKGLMEAQCDYVLNNTAWKLTGNVCPLAMSTEPQTKRFSRAQMNFTENYPRRIQQILASLQ